MKEETEGLLELAQNSAKNLFFTWRNEIEKIFFSLSESENNFCSYTRWVNLKKNDKVINSGFYGTLDGMYHFMNGYAIWFPKTSQAMLEFRNDFGKLCNEKKLGLPSIIESLFDGKNDVKFKFYATVDEKEQEEYAIAKKKAETLVGLLSDFNKFSKFTYFEDCADASEGADATYFIGIQSSYNLWEAMIKI